MTTSTTINRRQFVALSAATAATSAISTTALAKPLSQTNPKPLRIPAPSLARLLPSSDDPTKARLLPYTASNLSIDTLASPRLTLTPLPCFSNRLDTDASITIELHHPTPNLYSILYSAHNITIPNKSIPSHPSAIETKAPAATTTLKITQRIAGRAHAKILKLNTTAPGTYLLAIPTATHASNASFRFTAAHLDSTGDISSLTNPMPAASSRCAYFSITIKESTGA